MAAADYKELAQCFAFAYFAETLKQNNTDYKRNERDLESKHALGFYSLFHRKAQTDKYRAYLSDNFPTNAIKDAFKIKYNDKDEVIYSHSSMAVPRKVYVVAKYLYESGIIPKNKFHEYVFLGQEDSFTQTIKDKCIINIRKTFSVEGKLDQFSSVDVFIVKKTSKQKIQKDFEKSFLSGEEEIYNSFGISEGKRGESYSEKTRKYMKSGELIPISLKLLMTVTSIPKIKLIDSERLRNRSQKDFKIDPFIKFLGLLVNDKQNFSDHINNLIEFDYDSFVAGEKLNWEIPVKFNYNKVLLDPSIKNQVFLLFAQGHGAGWNGQFDRKDKDTLFSESGQWVGGVSVSTFEQYANKYPSYKKCADELRALRVKHFANIVKEIRNDKLNEELKKTRTEPNITSKTKKDGTTVTKNLPPVYKHLTGMLKEHGIFKKSVLFFGTPGNEKKKIAPEFGVYQKFFEKFNTPQKNYGDLFLNNFINDIRSQIPKFKTKRYEIKTPAFKYSHFVHAQLCYFIYKMQGESHEYFKRRLFLTVFGLITKKSHKMFEEKEMRALIEKTIKDKVDKKKSHILRFDTAPHYIIS